MVVGVAHSPITEAARTLLTYWVFTKLILKISKHELAVLSERVKCVSWPGPVMPDLLAASFPLFCPHKLV